MIIVSCSSKTGEREILTLTREVLSTSISVAIGEIAGTEVTSSSTKITS